jgi:hypothetical protein
MDDVDTPWIPGNPFDRSVVGFLIRHGTSAGPMSRKFYTEMQRRGIGPRETIIGNKTIITASDERAWEEARANPTGDEAKAVAAVRAWRHRRAKKAGAAAVASAKHVSNQKRGKRRK